MPPPIPDRWIPYKACGKIIDGTRIVCFKVPLRRSVQVNKKEISEIWDIDTLIKRIPKLGAVVDLTNTTRYYNPADLVSAGILHKKILMPGHILPPEGTVKEFMDTVDEFLGKDCEMVVGVHCTHGLNRTGYMVCRYMRDRLGIAGKDAIKKFEKARGYKIERENYIADILGEKPLPPDPFTETKIRPLGEEGERSWRKRNRQEDDESYASSIGGWKKSCRSRSNTKNDSGKYSSRDSGTSNQSPVQDYEKDAQFSRDRYSTRGKPNGRMSRWDNEQERRRRKNTEESYDYRHDY